MLTEVREAHELLARTPGVLDAWLRDLSEPWLEADEGEGTYDAHDVVGHLNTGEEVDWIPRMRLILEHGESRAFTPFDREGFREPYGKWSIGELLDRFAALRRDNLAALLALDLTREDLARTGTHPELGRVTLEQLLATWVAHDLTHIAQIARVMAKRYGVAVGPWRAYLSVLGDRTQ